MHKGNVYPGEHAGHHPARALGPGARHPGGEPAGTRQQEPRADPALLQGLIFGPTGGPCRPPTRAGAGGSTATTSASGAEGRCAATTSSVRRVSAAEIEAAVIDQVRALLRQPEIIVGTWLAARAELPDLTEDETREALERLDPLWDELFPAEQARIVRLLVERVEIGPAGADIRLRIAGLTSLVRDLGATRDDAVAAAA